MADEREGARAPSGDPPSQDRMMASGKGADTAQPRYWGAEPFEPAAGPEQVEARSFDPAADAPTARHGAAEPKQGGYMGPGGDPAEGKR